MDNNFNIFNYLSMFCMYLIDAKSSPEDDLRKIETCRSFDGLYA